MNEQEQPIRRERKDVQRNLERVLQAARELFAAYGPDVKMEDVARRAGVGVGTIYRRFEGKEQLFAAVSQAACQDAHLCVAEAAAAAVDPIAQIRAIVHTQYQRGVLAAALLARRPADEADGEPDLYESLQALLLSAIIAGQQRGQIRSADPVVLAAIGLALLDPQTISQLVRLNGGCAEQAAEAALLVLLGGMIHPEARCNA